MPDLQPAIPDHTRRNRTISIVAGAVTVAAIVLGFAGDFLGLPWHWMRPAAELLLLAELVGLVVLERHQLFEPVQGKVDSIDRNLAALRVNFSELSQRFEASGQISFFGEPLQTVQAISRALQEAAAREQTAPQVLRWARLADYPRASTNPELGAELQKLLASVMAFQLLPTSHSDSKNRLWTLRNILTFTRLESFDLWRENIAPVFNAQNPLNVETKILIRARGRAEAVLTPNLITERDAIVTLDDDNLNNRWGFRFQSLQYVAVFARWFDELWTSIPESYLIQTRSGPDERAVARIRKELEAMESGRVEATLGSIVR
jgi:hypothetical protein